MNKGKYSILLLIVVLFFFIGSLNSNLVYAKRNFRSTSSETRILKSRYGVHHFSKHQTKIIYRYVHHHFRNYRSFLKALHLSHRSHISKLRQRMQEIYLRLRRYHFVSHHLSRHQYQTIKTLAVHHYHINYQILKNKFKKHRSFLKVNHSFIEQIKRQTFNDINDDRKRNGEKPYQYNPYLRKIAQQRVKQAVTDYDNPNFISNIHIDPRTGKMYRQEVKDADHITNQETDDYKYTAENVTPIYFSHRFNWGSGSFGKEATQDTTTPKRIADNEDRAMINYDQSSNNGHRNNILDKASHYIGISCEINNRKIYNNNYGNPNGALVEEFA